MQRKMDTANPAQLPLKAQTEYFCKVLSSNPTLSLVLSRAHALNLPDWYLAAGSISQTIWNHMSGLPPENGISDYDLVYYDASDLSWEAEDAFIQAGKLLFADIDAEVEIRNQARVHLWYGEKHGVPCPPHASVEAGIDSWISSSAIIGVRQRGSDAGEEWDIYAPRGLSDFFNMVVRPNAVLGTREAFEKKARRWVGIWDKLVIEPWPHDDKAKP